MQYIQRIFCLAPNPCIKLTTLGHTVLDTETRTVIVLGLTNLAKLMTYCIYIWSIVYIKCTMQKSFPRSMMSCEARAFWCGGAPSLQFAGYLAQSRVWQFSTRFEQTPKCRLPCTTNSLFAGDVLQRYSHSFFFRDTRNTKMYVLFYMNSVVQYYSSSRIWEEL